MQPEHVGRIITDYGAVLVEPSTLCLARNIVSLPHLKTEIKAALNVALSVTDNAALREQLKMAYISLAEFQPLTASEVHALRTWKEALASGVTAGADGSLSSEAATVISVGQRITDEGKALKTELEALGFW